MTPGTPSTRALLLAGLWTDNPALVKLLGLCPLLAVSNTAINALGLGIATLITLVISNTMVSVFRHYLLPAIRIPLYVLVIASVVTCIELLIQAWLPQLHRSLGIFLPLIVTNCLIMGRAEAFASRQPVKASIVDALAMGLGFLVVLLLLGMARELIGLGSLFTGAAQLLGTDTSHTGIKVFDAEYGVLIALLPPGAFFILAALLVAKRKIDR
ncbi:MAG: electron transport complex subunit E [Granulosicoccaceae bacterium]